MQVNVKVSGIKEALKKCDQKLVMRAAQSAINKTAEQTKTRASQLIREEFNVSARDVNKFLKVSGRASGDKLEAHITGRGLGMALSAFGARQAGVSVSKKKGFRYTNRAQKMLAAAGGALRRGGNVTVEVRKGSRKVVQDEPKPFMAMTKAGHIGVFKRIGKSRLPIKQLLGPGIGGLFGRKETMENLKKFASEKFKSLFDHELKWRS